MSGLNGEWRNLDMEKWSPFFNWGDGWYDTKPWTVDRRVNSIIS